MESLDKAYELLHALRLLRKAFVGPYAEVLQMDASIIEDSIAELEELLEIAEGEIG